MSADTLPDWCLMPSPLFLDGWLEFNRDCWGLEPRRARYTPKGGDLPALEAVLYLDRRGRVCMPPRNPYLPIRFTPSTMETSRRWHTEWLTVSAALADELRRRGVRGQIALPPGFIDGREFGWRGLRVEVRYTFCGSLPHPHSRTSPSVRNKARKAEKLGYYAKETEEWDEVAECLFRTESVKGFSHRTGARELGDCALRLGAKGFLAVGGFAPNGQMVCAYVALLTEGGAGLEWSAATDREHLASGVTQLVREAELNKLADAGCHAFDMLGANIKPVALAKAAWGFQLTPYLTMSERNGRNLIRDCISMSESMSRWAHAIHRNWFLWP